MLFSVAQIVKTRLKQNRSIIFDMSYVRTKDKNNVLIITLICKESIICNDNKMQNGIWIERYYVRNKQILCM